MVLLEADFGGNIVPLADQVGADLSNIVKSHGLATMKGASGRVEGVGVGVRGLYTVV